MGDFKTGLVLFGLVFLVTILISGCLGGGPEPQSSATPSAIQTAGGPSDAGGLTKTKTGLTFSDPEMRAIYEAALK
ncbi:MAG: hypothetical protein V1811_00005, partial [Candidatus Micrarchaeota archaeon]